MPPGYAPPPVTPPANKKILGMSGGVFAVVLVAVLLLCCLAPLGLGAVLFRYFNADDGATAEITTCRMTDAVILGGVQVEYTITNNSSTARSFLVDIEVLDTAGNRVGQISDSVSTINPGATAHETATLLLQYRGGIQCRVAKIT